MECHVHRELLHAVWTQEGWIIDITLNPKMLKTWALSLHVCGQLVEDVSTMREFDRSSSMQTTHKEEIVPTALFTDSGEMLISKMK